MVYVLFVCIRFVWRFLSLFGVFLSLTLLLPKVSSLNIMKSVRQTDRLTINRPTFFPPVSPNNNCEVSKVNIEANDWRAHWSTNQSIRALLGSNQTRSRSRLITYFVFRHWLLRKGSVPLVYTWYGGTRAFILWWITLLINDKCPRVSHLFLWMKSVLCLRQTTLLNKPDRYRFFSIKTHLNLNL